MWDNFLSVKYSPFFPWKKFLRNFIPKEYKNLHMYINSEGDHIIFASFNYIVIVDMEMKKVDTAFLLPFIITH